MEMTFVRAKIKLKAKRKIKTCIKPYYDKYYDSFHTASFSVQNYRFTQNFVYNFINMREAGPLTNHSFSYVWSWGFLLEEKRRKSCIERAIKFLRVSFDTQSC